MIFSSRWQRGRPLSARVGPQQDIAAAYLTTEQPSPQPGKERAVPLMEEKIAAAPCPCECRESCLLLIGSGCGAHRCGGLSVPHPSVKGETLICWFRPRKSTGRSGNPKPGLSSLRPRPDSGKGAAQPFFSTLAEGQTGWGSLIWNASLYLKSICTYRVKLISHWPRN